MCSAEELIRTGRRMVELDLVVGSLGNLSCRQAETVLLTPTGLDYFTIEPEDIVILDQSGRKLAGRGEPSSEFQLHLAIYQAQDEAQAIVHTHSAHALALSLIVKELPALTEELESVVGTPVPVVPYTPAGTQQLAERTAKALGEEGRAIILERHGVVGIGASLNEAFLICQLVERNAKIYLLTGGITPPSPWA